MPSYTGFATLVKVDHNLKAIIEEERRIALENAKKKVVKKVITKGDRSPASKPFIKWIAIGVEAAAAAGPPVAPK